MEIIALLLGSVRVEAWLVAGNLASPAGWELGSRPWESGGGSCGGTREPAGWPRGRAPGARDADRRGARPDGTGRRVNASLIAAAATAAAAARGRRVERAARSRSDGNRRTRTLRIDHLVRSPLDARPFHARRFSGTSSCLSPSAKKIYPDLLEPHRRKRVNTGLHGDLLRMKKKWRRLVVGGGCGLSIHGE